MVRSIFFLSIFFYSVACFAQDRGITRQEWNDVFSNVTSSCIVNQRNYPANAGLSDRQIEAFCSCVGRFTANSLTSNDVNYIVRTGDPSPMISASRRAFAACAP